MPRAAKRLPTAVIVAALLSAAAEPAQPLGLDDFTRLADASHPKLAQAAFAVEAARGQAEQAGKYPNPTVEVRGDEISDVQGPGGIWTAPFFSQEIVTRGKLRLDRAAALRAVDQATLGYCVQRYALFAAVRQYYFEALALQRRLEVLGELVDLAEKSAATARRQFAAGQDDEFFALQFETELERVRAEKAAAEAELLAAFRRLAAAAGAPDLPPAPLVGSLDFPLPDYDLESLGRQVRDTHPEVMAARVGADRARLLLRRAEVERTPNVTVGAGYMRQNQNKSNDWAVGVSLPVPLWNRNQGNVRAARAELGSATWESRRVEAELVERVAAAFRDYAAARQRAERVRTRVLPLARRNYELTARGQAAGVFDSLKLLQAQRAVAEANLEYLKSAGDAWKAAAALSGLLLEEQWPVVKK